ncbi:MAG: DNA polymerase I [Candidatus Delongbacteria bacterium]|nr:DNA polymerase I [Candidatus Delongbacteria bacterium]MCG2761526.1 DNA polymerase I [Candidatus Delongbacteria bacterium]
MRSLLSGTMGKKLYLIDGYGLIYRAFYAFGAKPLITKEGFNVSALYGFFSSLFNLIENEAPEYMAIVLDTAAPTFRHILYPDYKATREKMPEELRNQIPMLYEMIEATGIQTISKEGYEADDLIGAISKAAPELGYTTYIFSSDKDLAQLVNENVFIFDPKDQTIYDREGVKLKYGIYPYQIMDFLTLTGDTSDNIPGVPKIGKKTAIKLLNEYGTIEGIFQNIDKISGNAVRESLLNSKEIIKISSELVALKTDIPVELDEDKLHIKSYDFEKLADYFYKLNMRRLLEYLERKQGVKNERTKDDRYDPEKYNFIDVEERKSLTELIKRIKKTTRFSVVIDIDGDHLLNYKIKSIAISIEELEAYFISREFKQETVQLSLFDTEEKDSIAEFLSDFKEIFENDKITLIGFDIKKCLHALKNYGLTVKCKLFDALIADFLVRTSVSSHEIISIARHHLHHFALNEKDPSFEKKIIECEKAELVMRSYYKLKEDLCANDEVEKIFYDMEIPLLKILFMMERNGIKIDRSILENISKEMASCAKELEKTIHILAGEEFNLDSPKQLSVVLFEKLNLKSGRKGTSGTYSTDHAILKRLAYEKFPIAELLLKYRELSKLNNTYAGGLLKYIFEPTGRIHTTFLQHIATTGRLSSANPNLQSIPIKNEAGEKIRTAFVAKKGYKIISVDYSQIELRILAHLCRDENLIEAFSNGIDIHKATASKLFGVDVDEVTKEMRSRAKTVNFAVLYGKSKFGLSDDMGISYQEASDFIDLYFSQFKKIKEYIDDTTLFIEQYGYVKTMFGRKREIPEIRSSNKNIKSAAIRAAVNAPIQGASADIIKMAMIKIDSKLNGYDAIMLLQIHDELVFEVKEETVEKFSNFIKHEMETVSELSVPLEVNVGIGDNWLDAH